MTTSQHIPAARTMEAQITAWTTPSGRLAIKAQAPGGLSEKKYVSGGYNFYLINALAVYRNLDGSALPQPILQIAVLKRSRYAQVVQAEKAKRGGVILGRQPGTVGEYVVVS